MSVLNNTSTGWGVSNGIRGFNGNGSAGFDTGKSAGSSQYSAWGSHVASAHGSSTRASTGDVRFVFNPDGTDQIPLQLEEGDSKELTLLLVLAVVSVLAFDLTEELGDKPLLRGATDTSRGTGRGGRRAWGPVLTWRVRAGLVPALRLPESSRLKVNGGDVIMVGCHCIVNGFTGCMAESSSGSEGSGIAGTSKSAGWTVPTSRESISTISLAEESSVASPMDGGIQSES